MNRTNAEIREIITSTAQDQAGDPREDQPGWDEYYGYGRIDMYEALNSGKSPAEKNENRKEEDTQSNKGDINNAGDHQAKAVDKNGSSEDNNNDGESKKAHRADR